MSIDNLGNQIIYSVCFFNRIIFLGKKKGPTNIIFYRKCWGFFQIFNGKKSDILLQRLFLHLFLCH